MEGNQEARAAGRSEGVTDALNDLSLLAAQGEAIADMLSLEEVLVAMTTEGLQLVAVDLARKFERIKDDLDKVTL